MSVSKLKKTKKLKKGSYLEFNGEISFVTVDKAGKRKVEETLDESAIQAILQLVVSVLEDKLNQLEANDLTRSPKV